MLMIFKVITKYRKSGCRRIRYYVNGDIDTLRNSLTREQTHKFLREVYDRNLCKDFKVYKIYKYR